MIPYRLQVCHPCGCCSKCQVLNGVFRLTRCKGTNNICNKSSYHKKIVYFNLFTYKNTYFNGTKYAKMLDNQQVSKNNVNVFLSVFNTQFTFHVNKSLIRVLVTLLHGMALLYGYMNTHIQARI